MVRPGPVRAPAWWHGEGEAAESSIEAARQMGFMVGQYQQQQ